MPRFPTPYILRRIADALEDIASAVHRLGDVQRQAYVLQRHQLGFYCTNVECCPKDSKGGRIGAGTWVPANKSVCPDCGTRSPLEPLP